MWCYRWMGNISWKDKITNANVLIKLGTKRTLLKDVQKRKLRYYGHIKRKNNILTTALEGRMSGKRPRGRPRINWFTDVKEWSGLSAAECTRRAANRNLWSVITSQPSQRRWHSQVNPGKFTPFYTLIIFIALSSHFDYLSNTLLLCNYILHVYDYVKRYELMYTQEFSAIQMLYK